jgi:hypothetical protein
MNLPSCNKKGNNTEMFKIKNGDRRCGSSSRVALQVRIPEFKPQSHKKQNKIKLKNGPGVVAHAYKQITWR